MFQGFPVEDPHDAKHYEYFAPMLGPDEPIHRVPASDECELCLEKLEANNSTSICNECRRKLDDTPVLDL